jgi:hypothetical protein
MSGFLAAGTGTVDNTELIIVIITVGVTVGTIVIAAVIRFFLGRRVTSGKIETSEAAVVWQQAQSMRETLMSQVQRAEEQRDRLLEAQSANVLPALAALNSSMTSVHDVLARNREAYTAMVSELRDAMAENRATITQYGGMVEEMRDGVLAAASRGSPDLPPPPSAGRPPAGRAGAGSPDGSRDAGKPGPAQPPRRRRG